MTIDDVELPADAAEFQQPEANRWRRGRIGRRRNHGPVAPAERRGSAEGCQHATPLQICHVNLPAGAASNGPALSVTTHAHLTLAAPVTQAIIGLHRALRRRG